MPGPVSDSYDPEFGTAHNAATVCDAVTKVRNKVSKAIGDTRLKPIVEVVQGKEPKVPVPLVPLTERELRIIRFAMNRALESL